MAIIIPPRKVADNGTNSIWLWSGGRSWYSCSSRNLHLQSLVTLMWKEGQGQQLDSGINRCVWQMRKVPLQHPGCWDAGQVTKGEKSHHKIKENCESPFYGGANRGCERDPNSVSLLVWGHAHQITPREGLLGTSGSSKNRGLRSGVKLRGMVSCGLEPLRPLKAISADLQEACVE